MPNVYQPGEKIMPLKGVSGDLWAELQGTWDNNITHYFIIGYSGRQNILYKFPLPLQVKNTTKL